MTISESQNAVLDYMTRCYTASLNPLEEKFTALGQRLETADRTIQVCHKQLEATQRALEQQRKRQTVMLWLQILLLLVLAAQVLGIEPQATLQKLLTMLPN